MAKTSKLSAKATKRKTSQGKLNVLGDDAINYKQCVDLNGNLIPCELGQSRLPDLGGGGKGGGGMEIVTRPEIPAYSLDPIINDPAPIEPAPIDPVGDPFESATQVKGTELYPTVKEPLGEVLSRPEVPAYTEDPGYYQPIPQEPVSDPYTPPVEQKEINTEIITFKPVDEGDTGFEPIPGDVNIDDITPPKTGDTGNQTPAITDKVVNTTTVINPSNPSAAGSGGAGSGSESDGKNKFRNIFWIIVGVTAVTGFIFFNEENKV